MIKLRRLQAEEAITRTQDVLSAEVLDSAAAIVERVRLEGDTALRELAVRFDGLGDDSPMVLERPALEAALDSLDSAEREVLERTQTRIRDFARQQREALTDLKIRSGGIEMGHTVTAVPVAGCYAPGGRYPLPSSVLMTAVTARVAGVETIVLATPSRAPVMLAAAAVAGVDRVLNVGGAQAIAAMAFGTGTIPACDVIVGPGNAWVTAAKQLVAGHVRIDALAGPSELLIVADGSSDPALVAADLLAQAEHDPDAVPLLLTVDEDLVGRVEDELERQLGGLPTSAIARQALQNGGAILASDLEEAVRTCNAIAPEHLQWVAGDERPVRRLTRFGGLFVGEGAAEVLGDYGAGPNHTLPTGGQARSRGGLSVFDFLKVSTWMRGSDPRVAADAAALARIEGLEAHARAAERRERAPDPAG